MGQSGSRTPSPLSLVRDGELRVQNFVGGLLRRRFFALLLCMRHWGAEPPPDIRRKLFALLAASAPRAASLAAALPPREVFFAVLERNAAREMALVDVYREALTTLVPDEAQQKQLRKTAWTSGFHPIRVLPSHLESTGFFEAVQRSRNRSGGFGGENPEQVTWNWICRNIMSFYAAEHFCSDNLVPPTPAQYFRFRIVQEGMFWRLLGGMIRDTAREKDMAEWFPNLDNVVRNCIVVLASPFFHSSHSALCH